jgi:uncharacterized protein (TIGR03086 family)
MLDLQPAADEVRRIADGVSDDQLSDPTPCQDTPVAALLDHLLGLCLAFTWAARKRGAPGGGPGSAPGPAAAASLDPDWRALLPRRLDDLVAAWRAPEAWTGMTEAGGIQLPGEVAGVVALDELVLHGWDLARATGQDFSCDESSTAAVLEFTKQTAHPDEAAGREGLFGPVVDVPADAPAFDRALGFAGRHPRWSPTQGEDAVARS